MDPIRKELIKKFHGKTKIVSRYKPKFPISAEREYFRLANSYMNELKQVIEENVPGLKAAVYDGTRYDSAKDNEKERKNQRITNLTRTTADIEAVFANMNTEMEKRLGVFDLKHKLELMANMTRKLTIKEWNKVLEKTLGISLFDDIYNGGTYRELFDTWVDDNVNLISTVPFEALDKMKQTVFDGYVNGRTMTSIMQDIQREYGMSKRHARLIARDQMGKLNCQITKQQHKSAGVTHYEWSDSGDSRVRRSHKELDGKIFDWDKPPDVGNGRRCNPGEDYQCRCCAIPVLDLEKLDVPVKESDMSKVHTGYEVIPEPVKKVSVPKEKPAVKKTTVPKTRTTGNTKQESRITAKSLDNMSLDKLRSLAEKTAIEYYKSGASGISFGNSSVEHVAKVLAQKGSKTSLKRDILSMQRALNK